jgi:hypothetical protein
VAQLGDVRIPRAFLSGKFAIYQGVWLTIPLCKNPFNPIEVY